MTTPTDPTADTVELPICCICSAPIEPSSEITHAVGIGVFHTIQKTCSSAAYRLGLAHGKREGRRAELTRIMGERCTQFEESCLCCTSWQELDELERGEG